jgi:hypothetical protein
MKTSIVKTIVALSLISLLSGCNEKDNVAKIDYTIVGDTFTTDTFTYTGGIANNMPNGVGTMSFSWGDVYEGEVVQGVPCGEGHMVYSDGSTYTGEWKSAMRHGKGRYTDANGNWYDGDWKNGFREGYGVMMIDGVKQAGTFENDQPKKVALLDLTNCITGDCRSGYGVEKFADGVYSGNYENGEFHGHGKYSYKNGDVFIGQFIRGQRHGKGTLNRYSEHYTIDGYFENGVWKEGLKTYSDGRPDMILMRHIM